MFAPAAHCLTKTAGCRSCQTFGSRFLHRGDKFRKCLFAVGKEHQRVVVGEEWVGDAGEAGAPWLMGYPIRLATRDKMYRYDVI